MHYSDYIPRPDEAFHLFQENLIEVLPGFFTKLGITTAQLEPLVAAQAVWRDAWGLVCNPATRTSVAITNKDAAREAYEAAIRKLVRRYITGNDDLTNGDRQLLGLPPRKEGRTPILPPDDYPEAWFDTSILREVHAHFRPRGSEHRAKADLMHGAEAAWSFLDSPPTDVEQLIRSAFDTRSPLKLTFKESERGKTLYIAFRWEAPNGSKGPWSPIYSVVIP
ncbi:hypothetical protein OpiT1DRAFT_01428 [Opitutaceae bacterium TAV1]|nr:hypothetical protein OPIT5_19725 [Opitutaceae bacterium TAV5]EIP97001.1 hypothetical protein OpiT1DRAFT_01428 [Opitutaceae bacterium TAV1]